MSKIISIADIIAWCDKQAADGLKLELCWEGGGDSGWVYFELDESSAEGEEIEALVDMMYNELDYGCWAGEFSASGRAEYNPETKCFDGVDHYSYEDWDTLTLENPIEIRVPKSFGFDDFEYNFEGNYEDDLRVETTFHIVNGFITPEMIEFEKELNFLEQIDAEFKEVPNVRYLNEHKSISRNQFEEDGEFLVYKIETCGYSTETDEPRDVIIDLQERLNNETENE